MRFAQALSLGALVMAAAATTLGRRGEPSRPRFLNSTSKPFTKIATSFITVSSLTTEVSSEWLNTTQV